MPILKLGARGNEVKALQRQLRKVNARPRPKIDGQFGPMTDKSLRGFQKAHKLKVDGIAEEKTLNMLDALIQDPIEVRMPGYAVRLPNKIRAENTRAKEIERMLDTCDDIAKDVQKLAKRVDAFRDELADHQKAARGSFAEYRKIIDEVLGLKKEFDTARFADRGRAMKLRREIKRLNRDALKAEEAWEEAQTVQRRFSRRRDMFERLLGQLLKR